MKGRSKSSNVCAWCIYRDGDMCINPKSPVNTRNAWRDILDMLISPATTVFGGKSARYFKGECGPACRGEIECAVAVIKYPPRVIG